MCLRKEYLQLVQSKVEGEFTNEKPGVYRPIPGNKCGACPFSAVFTYEVEEVEINGAPEVVLTSTVSTSNGKCKNEK